MKRNLLCASLVLASGSAIAQTHFSLVVSGPGFALAVGDFHQWHWHDGYYYDRWHHRHSRREYYWLAHREREWDDDRDREWRHDNGRHLGWYKHGRGPWGHGEGHGRGHDRD